MKISYPFSKNWARGLLVFLVAASASSAAIFYGVDTKLRPTPQETMSFFVAASFQNEQGTKAYRAYKSALSSQILSFHLWSYDSKDSSFRQAYSYYGRNADVLILPESVLGEDLSLFADLPEEYRESAYQNKGALVYAPDQGNWPSGNYFSYHAENYYAFINTKSLHISSLDSSKKDDEALSLFAYLVKGPSDEA